MKNEKLILLQVFLFVFVMAVFIWTSSFVSAGFSISPSNCNTNSISFSDARGFTYNCANHNGSSLWYYTYARISTPVLATDQNLVSDLYNWEFYHPELGNLNWTNFSQVLGITSVNISGKGVGYSSSENEFSFFFQNRTDAVLKIGNDTFKYIVPSQVNPQKYPAGVVVDKNGDIISAQFIVDEPGGYYTLDKKNLHLPAGSAVSFSNESGLNVTLPDNFNMSSFPNLLLPSGVPVNGKNIVLPNGAVVTGTILSSPNGYILSGGSATYDSMQFSCDSSCQNSGGLLIANANADLSGYSGNFIQENSNTLEIKSSVKNSEGLKVNFLGGNKILDTTSKEDLVVTVKSGDGLKFTSRASIGLIPFVVHESSTSGESMIENGHMDITLKGEKVYMTPPIPLSDQDFAKNHYQSVAMEIQPTGNTDNLIRINAYRQFVMLSGTNSLATVSYNQYGLPVSDLISDNNLKTLDQLRAKYPSVNFGFQNQPDNTPGSKGQCMIQVGTETYHNEPCINDSNLPPYFLYLTDTFFKENPKALNEIKYINYSTLNNAFGAGGNTMMIGLLTEPYNSIDVRQTTSPLQIMTHEYEHIQDESIQKKELKYIESLNDPSIKLLTDRADSLNSQIQQLNLEYANAGGATKSSIQSDISQKQSSLSNTYAFILQEYYDNYPDVTLLQTYNQIVMGGKMKVGLLDLPNSIGFKSSFNDLKKNIEKNSFSDLNNILKQNGYPANYNGGPLSSSQEAALKDIEATAKSNKDILESSQMLNLNPILKASNNLNGVVNAYNSLQSFGGISNPTTKLYRDQLNNLVRTYTGLPYVYSLTDDDPSTGFNKVAVDGFEELPATFAEEPISMIKSEVNSGNNIIRSTYRELTQVRFDSGKMSLSEYKTIMGAGYCKTSDCSDTLCTDYKLLCCVNHPDVPHCQSGNNP